MVRLYKKDLLKLKSGQWLWWVIEDSKGNVVKKLPVRFDSCFRVKHVAAQHVHYLRIFNYKRHRADFTSVYWNCVLRWNLSKELPVGYGLQYFAKVTRREEPEFLAEVMTS